MTDQQTSGQADDPSSGDKPDDGFAREEWTYAGMRLDRKGKPMHEWFSPTDEDALVFSKGGTSVGSVYSIEVKREGDGVSARFGGSMRYTGKSEDARVPKWAVLHRAAQAEQEAVRAEARAKREQGGLIGPMTLAEARGMYHRATAGQKAGVITMVTKYLMTGEPN